MCPSAAVMRSSRVGKWCWAAPRDTPAAAATAPPVVAAQPCVARRSMEAPSSRSRVMRLRSCLGARCSGAVMPLLSPVLFVVDDDAADVLAVAHVLVSLVDVLEPVFP